RRESGWDCRMLGEQRFLGPGLDGGPRSRRDLADRLRVLEVRVDGGDDDPRLDGDEIDADQRHAHPGIDDDSLVQYSIEHVDEAGPAGGPFNWHRSPPGLPSRR